MLGIKAFRELIEQDSVARVVLYGDDFLDEKSFSGRILKKVAEGDSAREACRYSYEWERKNIPEYFRDEPESEFGSFYTPSQINNTVNFSLRHFLKKYKQLKASTTPLQHDQHSAIF